MLGVAKVLGRVVSLGARLAVLMVLAAYKVALSPVLGPACRFYPSCSEYAMAAVRGRGVLPGLLLAAWRLVRCNPLCPGGYDPVRLPATASGSTERVPAGTVSG